MSTGSRVRRRLVVRGVVQGVGFRPHVYALASSLHLSGAVWNDAAGVVIEVEGAGQLVDTFSDRLQAAPPPLAHVADVSVADIPAVGGTGFTILASAPADGRTLVSPDVADLRRLPGRAGRPGRPALPPPVRHLHPLRPALHHRHRPALRPGHTTMAVPDVRRLRPRVRGPGRPALPRPAGRLPRLRAAAARWSSPGRAGLHGPRPATRSTRGPLLAAGARSSPSRASAATTWPATPRTTRPCALLRRRKAPRRQAVRGDGRATSADVGRLVRLDAAEERTCSTGRGRPIVLLRRRPRRAGGLAEAVAPGSPDLGVMLPYTPAAPPAARPARRPARAPPARHDQRQPSSGEPIVTDDAEALDRLAAPRRRLAHPRPADPRAVRRLGGPGLRRRASCRSAARAATPRCRSPCPLRVPAALAVGGDLKNTFCLGEGRQAWLSAHIGDMDDLATLTRLRARGRPAGGVTGVRPETAGRRPASRLPLRRVGRPARRRTRPVVRVQHHHAHVAAAMAEHGLDGTRPVIGVAFDGTGYGDDGAVWGGEFLLADYDGFTAVRAPRATSRCPAATPRVRRPYRMALAHLQAAGLRWAERPARACAACPPERTPRPGTAVGARAELRPDLQHGPALRRRLLAGRGLPPGRLRGAGRRRAGGARRSAPGRDTGRRTPSRCTRPEARPGRRPGRRSGTRARRRSSATCARRAGRPGRGALPRRRWPTWSARGLRGARRERHGLDTVALTRRRVRQHAALRGLRRGPARRTASPCCGTAWCRPTTAGWRSAS